MTASAMLGRAAILAFLVGAALAFGWPDGDRVRAQDAPSTMPEAPADTPEGPADEPAQPTGEPTQQYPVAVLRALDKVTARVTTLYVAVGEPVQFGTLQIVADVCDKRPPEETPESAAFLDIVEQRPGKDATGVFHGWMFASSPGLSAMQHPVYDLWMLDCRSSAPSDASSSSAAGSP